MRLLQFDLEHLLQVIHSSLICEPPSVHEASLDPFSDVGRHVFHKDENEKPEADSLNKKCYGSGNLKLLEAW